MKYLAITLLFFTSFGVAAQVVFRNDFALGKQKKVKHNKGITFIAINFGRMPNYNMLVNGSGGSSLLIDVEALRGRKKAYSYTELAERIYTPGPVYRPGVPPVPWFLLSEPPIRGLRSFNANFLQVQEITAPRLQSFRAQ